MPKVRLTPTQLAVLAGTSVAHLRRVLRDLGDGHVTVYVTVCRFDTATGERLPAPLLRMSADRDDATLVDWPALVDAGVLRVRDVGRHARLELTDIGREVLAEHTKET